MTEVGWVALFATQRDWRRCWVAKSMQPNLQKIYFLMAYHYFKTRCISVVWINQAIVGTKTIT